MIPQQAVWVNFLFLESLPLTLERLSPRSSRHAMVTFDETLHLLSGLGNDPFGQYPGDQINARPIKSVEIVMLQPSPMRLDDHGRLQHWYLHGVAGPGPVTIALSSTN